MHTRHSDPLDGLLKRYQFTHTTDYHEKVEEEFNILWIYCIFDNQYTSSKVHGVMLLHKVTMKVVTLA